MFYIAGRGIPCSSPDHKLEEHHAIPVHICLGRQQPIGAPFRRQVAPCASHGGDVLLAASQP